MMIDSPELPLDRSSNQIAADKNGQADALGISLISLLPGIFSYDDQPQNGVV